ncbi:MAG: hypothetical protein ACK58T_13540, partial [Phycisphaerae bacterium]
MCSKLVVTGRHQGRPKSVQRRVKAGGVKSCEPLLQGSPYPPKEVSVYGGNGLLSDKPQTAGRKAMPAASTVE